MLHADGCRERRRSYQPVGSRSATVASVAHRSSCLASPTDLTSSVSSRLASVLAFRLLSTNQELRDLRTKNFVSSRRGESWPRASSTYGFERRRRNSEETGRTRIRRWPRGRNPLPGGQEARPPEGNLRPWARGGGGVEEELCTAWSRGYDGNIERRRSGHAVRSLVQYLAWTRLARRPTCCPVAGKE
jgi:hypothetical protein